ncbi:uncharacterized protein TRAVEDRAFT_26476 [Trametes versicolor FP-101664 SS1]|uniref:uncharacterized protein n=1 Tax=Trametes versicolor (strain FP-101664) TaxID=717944 RepID=UPI0004623583|nr:uncharacterized protein TRAVEDRAFT_26476 [Trametes versicolor FP-101664 SS1]EIW62985.1 hypothetical protein TRAVEDRAFT_26476 [Trametes versicolor FP-101664 SS1]
MIGATKRDQIAGSGNYVGNFRRLPLGNYAAARASSASPRVLELELLSYLFYGM